MNADDRLQEVQDKFLGLLPGSLPFDRDILDGLSEFEDAIRAAALAEPLDVERLAVAYGRVRGAHNGPDGFEGGPPCDWCRLAAEQHIEANAIVFVGDEPNEGVRDYNGAPLR